MKKLHSIIVLERILLTYDTLGVDHRCPLHHYGLCVEEMLDDIISQLTRLIDSKTRLTYRNILVANYKTMTKPQHWLNCQMFDDLPRDESKMLQQKIFKMVDLMNTLLLKIVKEDGDYTERFFKRLMNSYQRNRATDYCIWKNLQPRITKKMVLEYQAELTADMLIMGILRFDESPTDDEMTGVKLDLLKTKMKHNKQYPEDFKAECAKLRRYAYWEGDCFMINYPLIRPYLYKKFDKLTKDQHMALFDYDVQMREIHEDLLAFDAKRSAAVLTSDKAMKYWKKLMELGFVDENCQLMKSTSRQQAMYIADIFADKLGLKHKWKTFEDHWGINNLAQEKWQLQQSGKMPPRYEDIGVVFEI